MALAATAGGWVGWGWRGAVLAVTVVVFVVLQQFNRAMRTMRTAASRPLGAIDSAVMLQARLRAGMRLIDVIGVAGSLGARERDAPETFVWTDAGGDAVRVAFGGARVARVELLRAPAPP